MDAKQTVDLLYFKNKTMIIFNGKAEQIINITANREAFVILDMQKQMNAEVKIIKKIGIAKIVFDIINKILTSREVN